MKKKILSICAWVSAMLFALFVGLYTYVLIADPKPYMDKSGIHWPSITIKRNPPVVIPNRPSKMDITNYPSVHISATKDWGGNLILFNQKGPYVGSTVSSMTESDSRSISVKGWDCLGIYFRLMKDVREPDNWWTFMISLWYPIILFAILPAIFMVKKLRGKFISRKGNR